MTDQQPIALPNGPEIEATRYNICENDEFWPVDVMQVDHAEYLAPSHPYASIPSLDQMEHGVFSETELTANDIQSLTEAPSTSSVSVFADSASKQAFGPRLPTPVPNWVIDSPIPTVFGMAPGNLLCGQRTPSTNEPGPTPPLNRIILYGKDPECILESVQMMRRWCHRLQDGRFRSKHTPSGTASDMVLRKHITSERFLSDIDEIALWAYQASGDMIREQRAARQASSTCISFDHVRMQDVTTTISRCSKLSSGVFLSAT